MPKVPPCSSRLYFSSHFNSGGSDANSVGKSLNSVGVSSQGSDSPDNTPAQGFGTGLKLGYGRNFTDVTTDDASGNHQTFYQALTNALECIVAGNSLGVSSSPPGSFTFNGFNFQLQHKSGAEFDLVLTIGPNHNNDLVNVDKLESLSHEIRSAVFNKLKSLSHEIPSAVLNFNSENRSSGSIQWNSASIEINPTLLVDCIGDNSVQLTQIINTLGWSLRSK